MLRFDVIPQMEKMLYYTTEVGSTQVEIVQGNQTVFYEAVKIY